MRTNEAPEMRPDDASVTQTRRVAKVFEARPVSDGAGVKLRRALGIHGMDMIDPFLMLDEFRSDVADDYIAGFPAHPHRGFETVTYVLAGRMQHKDSVGNTGDLGPGSVQWMTAGRGIIHAEMPQQEEGLMHGFQLWVNLPAAEKMTAPRYQDISSAQIPEVTPGEGVRARVLAGTHFGVTGPVTGVHTDPSFVDVALDPETEATMDTPRGHSAFIYVFEGRVALPDDGGRGDDGGRTMVPRGHLALLGDGARIALRGGPDGGRAIVLAGRPLHEPVARYGPFVMNTREELEQAFRDYRQGTLAQG